MQEMVELSSRFEQEKKTIADQKDREVEAVINKEVPNMCDWIKDVGLTVDRRLCIHSLTFTTHHFIQFLQYQLKKRSKIIIDHEKKLFQAHEQKIEVFLLIFVILLLWYWL